MANKILGGGLIALGIVALIGSVMEYNAGFKVSFGTMLGILFFLVWGITLFRKKPSAPKTPENKQ